MRMTHTLAANCHINNPAWFLRRSSRSHLRNLLSASTFCLRVEQQQETLPHLLTWRLLMTYGYCSSRITEKNREVASKRLFECFPSDSDLPVGHVVSTRLQRNSRIVWFYSRTWGKCSLHLLNAALLSSA